MNIRHGTLPRVGCLISLLFSFGLNATPSSAAVGDLTCLPGPTGVNSTITFSPSLTYTPQMVTITSTNTFPNCTSNDPSITSASIPTSTHTALRSCNDLLNSGSGPLTLVYNNKQSSSSTYNSQFSASYLLGQLIVVDSGPVTSGEFTGSTAIGTAIYPANFLQCNGQGISSLTGTYTINIA